MADKNKSPSADVTEAAEFLDNLPRSAAETIVTIAPNGAIRATTYPGGSGARIAADLAAVQGRSNCYFHVNELRAGLINRKAKKGDVVSARMLHVDIDDLAGLERLRSFAITPTVTLFSGGGYQSFWFLDQPLLDLALAERLNYRIAELLGGDNCQNVDRLMRLPGTLNVPNAKKRAAGRDVALAYIVRDLTDFDRRYRLGDLELSLNADGPGLSAAGAIQPGGRLALTANGIPTGLSDYTRDLIRLGDHPKLPTGSEGAAYPSRSEVVFKVACDLARAGADENHIVAVLTNPANGVSASILEKAAPRVYALRQARQAIRSVGEGWPDMRKSGPAPSFANALIALTRLGLNFEFDSFRNRKRVSGHDIQELVGELTDDLCAALRLEVLNRWKFDLGKEHVRDAAQTLCIENTIHPILEYLDTLVWDGVSRVGTWLTDYLGAEPTPLHHEIGELVLMAAVRRVRRPGVKFDFILVLEGRQGTGKSSAISILAGDEYFSDQEILALDPKSQMEALEGIWIFEIGELQGLSRADIDRVKAFASRRVDRGRPVYTRFREDRPRQTIFIGTTNAEQYLSDATGNRRFWPVATGKVDLAGLTRDRDQLWAEAAHIEARGRPLALPEELWSAAGVAQDVRMVDDPWLEALAELRGPVEDGVEKVTTTYALHALEMSPDRQGPSSAKRLVPLMRKLGWAGPKPLRIKGKVVRGYSRPNDTSGDCGPPGSDPSEF